MFFNPSFSLPFYPSLLSLFLKALQLLALAQEGAKEANLEEAKIQTAY